MLDSTLSREQPVLRVNWREVGTLARAQLELVHAQLLVWQRPIGRLIVLPSGAGLAAARRQGDDSLEVGRIATAVDRASRRGLFRPSCLVRALALHRMLERSGIGESVVRIGVMQKGDTFLAHAWVEHRGATLLDPPAMIANFSTLADAQLADSGTVLT